MTMQDQKPFLERLAKGISAVFGSTCEVAIHDLTNGYENTIMIIENSHVTNRRIGDGASELVLQVLRSDGKNVKDMYNYLARTKEGRVIKCSSIFIRDEHKKVIGLVSINYDISELVMAKSVLDGLINTEENNTGSEMVNITTNVNDLLSQLLEESVQYIGKPVALMNKDDKIKAIQYLNERGALLIKKSGDKISRYFDISKYTLYNYIDSDRQQD